MIVGIGLLILKMKLQIIVTGSHLSSKHGLTYKEIEEDGFQIGFKVDIIEQIIDAQSTARAMSKAQNEITEILSEIKPDFISSEPITATNLIPFLSAYSKDFLILATSG